MELGVHFVHVQTFVLVGVKVLVHSLVNLEEQLLSLCVVVLSKRHTAVVCKLGTDVELNQSCYMYTCIYDIYGVTYYMLLKKHQ